MTKFRFRDLLLLILLSQFNIVYSSDTKFKDETQSLIEWEKINPEEWLSIDKWLERQKYYPDFKQWRKAQRENLRNELMGKILKCVGSCHVYRGKKYAEGQYLSQIKEGDVIKTQKDSFAWVLMANGSMLRISSLSSVSFNEINLLPEKFFFYLRVNEGHIYWKTRDSEAHQDTDMHETDPIFNPFQIAQANREFYEIEKFRSLDSKKKVEMSLEHFNGRKEQLQKLNTLKNEHNKKCEIRYESEVMVVSPNMTLIAKNPEFDFIYVLAGEGYIKARGPVQNQEAEKKQTSEQYQVALRGYDVIENISLEINKWYQVNDSGFAIEATESKKELNLFELLTKRIPTVTLAAEIQFEDFLPLFQKREVDELVTEFGYKLWKEEDQNKHYSFLKEYTRRVETSHLASIKKLVAENSKNIQVPIKEIALTYNAKALESYFKEISYTKKNNQDYVKYFSNNEYYFWLLHHAR